MGVIHKGAWLKHGVILILVLISRGIQHTVMKHHLLAISIRTSQEAKVLPYIRPTSSSCLLLNAVVH